MERSKLVVNYIIIFCAARVARQGIEHLPSVGGYALIALAAIGTLLALRRVVALTVTIWKELPVQG